MLARSPQILQWKVGFLFILKGGANGLASTNGESENLLRGAEPASLLTLLLEGIPESQPLMGKLSRIGPDETL